MPENDTRNIVICCDGTGNEFGKSNSNVLKLYTALVLDDRQLAYYHPGVGTMGDPGVRHWLARKWSVVKGLAFAAGFQANVFDAYQYLMRTFRAGDQVYLIGFSRGAYTIRALAGLLNGYGLLCPGNEGHLPYAWRLYTRQHKDRKLHTVRESIDYASSFKATFSRKDFTSIRFVGLWDTVSSVGWIYTPLRLFNTGRNALMITGRHAVSIDERRCFYTDNLWGPPYPQQDLVQAWFPGAHSDVGGSYPQSESYPANIALNWMIGEARTNGIRFDEDRVNLVLCRPTQNPYPALSIYTPPASPYNKIHKSLKGLWWLLELFPHRYYDRDDQQENWRVPFGNRRALPPGAIVHSSAIDRMNHSPASQGKYDPPNVRQTELVPLNPSTLNTNADLTGCYTYNPKPGPRPLLLRTPVRQLVVGIMALADVAVALALFAVLLFIACELLRLLHWLAQLCLFCALR